MLECPKCRQETSKLIIPERGDIMACRACVTTYLGHSERKSYNVNLGQTLDRSSHIDKKTGNEIKHRLTVGKAWEIDNRRLSQDDGITVVNRATGKPAQY